MGEKVAVMCDKIKTLIQVHKNIDKHKHEKIDANIKSRKYEEG